MRAADRIRRPATALVLLAVATVIVGCGSSEESAGTSADSSSVDTPAPATDTETPSATTTTTAAPTTAAPPGPTTTAPAGTALCGSAGLKLTLGPSEGAAGTVYRPLRFTNTGSSACQLQGFPGVSYVGGANGAQIGPAADHDGAKGAPVKLAPGGVASAIVGMVNIENFDPSSCHPTPVKGLRVYPPGETASIFVAAPGKGCSSTPPGPQLKVQTIKSGPGQS